MKLRMMRFRRLQMGLLFIFCLSGLMSVKSSYAIQSKDAGRNFVVGERLPDSISQKIEAGFQFDNSSWKIIICIFTKPEQRFSTRLKNDLQSFMRKHELAGLEVIEISVAQKTVQTSHWPLIFDPDSQLYQDVGITVLPTVYLFNTDWDIIGYFPGYSAGFTNALRQELSSIYPELKETPSPEISQKIQSYHRKENMAKALATRREYRLARTVLEQTDTLSYPGQILLGMLYFEAGEYQSSKDLFSGLVEDGSLQYYALYGLGIIALAENRPEIALQYLNKVDSIFDQKKIEFARGLAQKQLDAKETGNQKQISAEINRESLILIP